MPRLAIIGLGLIGGSLGLALKEAKLKEFEIAGFDESWDVSVEARKRGAVDKTARHPAEAAEGAAVVVIATPILEVRRAMEEIVDGLGEGAVVTDTASTKRDVLAWAEATLPDDVSFVGGHPIAGKETPGIGAADAELFQGRPWVLTPTSATPERSIRTIESLARAVGARPVVMDAAEHDSYLAAVSHLPLVVSAALFSLISESQAWPELAALAGPGFRDVTRLASTDPTLSHDIALTNRENLLHWLDRFAAEVARFRALIADDDQQEALSERFFTAQTKRDAFMVSPPQREQDTVDKEQLSAGERMLSFMVGEYIVRRRKQMEELLKERERGDDELRRKVKGR